MTPGTFRIYLGAAPGVGKTFAMLNEGRRRKKRGTDVVIGFVETHGRPSTAEQIGDVEVVPRRLIEYKGSTFEEMDTDAILARNPQVVLVDELAHTNVPGSRHVKRCEDVQELLAAGITVISTLNIQHLESVNDVVEQITGVKQQETIPDAVVRKADQVELVDMAPEAIRRRMAHGNIYPPERVDTALGNYFRPGNLAALRELALLWVADRVEEGLAAYRDRHGIDRPWETRERILVAITGSGDGDRLIRRGARMAARAHGDLIAVHVTSLAGEPPGSTLERQKLLVEELGGTVKEVAGDDIGETLVAAAKSLNATQIVLGATRRSRYSELMRGSVINRVIRASGIGIDVHVISREEAEAPTEPQRRRRAPALPPRRVALAFGLAAIGLPLLTLLIDTLHAHLGLPSILLLYLLAVVVVSAVGGLWPALATAVAGFLLANWFFTPPEHTFTISEGDNFIALVVFLIVATLVSGFVSLASRRAAEGARARAESEALVRLAGSSPVSTLLDTLRRVLALRSVALLHGDDSGWTIEDAAGEAPDVGEEHGGEQGGERRIALDERHELVLRGRAVERVDQRILDAFVAEITAAIAVEDLSAEMRSVDALSAAQDARAALLASTGRRLREVGARLGRTGGAWDEASIGRSAARLELLGGDLVDLGRIESGDLVVGADDVALPLLLEAALADACIERDRVRIDIDPSLPLVRADANLLRRAVVEAVAEAVDASPPGVTVRVVAGAVWPGIDVRVIDRRDSKRLAELDGSAGPGAFVAQAYVVAMQGRVEIDETPGGGTTLVIRLPAAGPTPAP